MAPFEADAQLAYLMKERIADIVITEDSDLLTFGCQRVCIVCVLCMCYMYYIMCICNSIYICNILYVTVCMYVIMYM